MYRKARHAAVWNTFSSRGKDGYLSGFSSGSLLVNPMIISRHKETKLGANKEGRGNLSSWKPWNINLEDILERNKKKEMKGKKKESRENYILSSSKGESFIIRVAELL